MLWLWLWLWLWLFFFYLVVLLVVVVVVVVVLVVLVVLVVEFLGVCHTLCLVVCLLLMLCFSSQALSTLKYWTVSCLVVASSRPWALTISVRSSRECLTSR